MTWELLSAWLHKLPGDEETDKSLSVCGRLQRALLPDRVCASSNGSDLPGPALEVKSIRNPVEMQSGQGLKDHDLSV